MPRSVASVWIRRRSRCDDNEEHPLKVGRSPVDRGSSPLPHCGVGLGAKKRVVERRELACEVPKVVSISDGALCDWSIASRAPALDLALEYCSNRGGIGRTADMGGSDLAEQISRIAIRDGSEYGPARGDVLVCLTGHDSDPTSPREFVHRKEEKVRRADEVDGL